MVCQDTDDPLGMHDPSGYGSRHKIIRATGHKFLADIFIFMDKDLITNSADLYPLPLLTVGLLRSQKKHSTAAAGAGVNLLDECTRSNCTC